jgi:16S rRNA (cytosine967-C5)-methyltransferase
MILSHSKVDGSGRSLRFAAHRILRRVEESGAYASILLDNALTSFSDPRDRALLHEIVLGVLRHRSVLDYVLGKTASRRVERLDPAVITALRIGVYALLFLDRIPDFAAVDTAVEIVKRDKTGSAAGFVNGVLRHVARSGRELLPEPPVRGDIHGLALTAGHPGWWVARLVERLGWDGTEELLRADNTPAITTLRVNRDKISPRDLADHLMKEDVHVKSSPWIPDALRVTDGVAHRTRAFQKGLFYIQDEASQLVPWMFGELHGRRVADLCAAPGGKTFQLAEGLPAEGLLVAVDRHHGRLRKLLGNAERLGKSGILAVAADLTARPALSGGFDHILLDAPCSGSGTFRRHPEIRWRIEEKAIGLLAERQTAMLEKAAALLAPGGTMVYSVCSLEPEEGGGVIAAFLRRRPDFRIRDPQRHLPAKCRRFVGSDLMLRTSPADGAMDGFFAVLLSKDPGDLDH